ncbi:hypothetical protein Hbl1158_10660 [Halobaculum sp. CBA1158]|uniref:hypothetical protein n=1 Tax=Halobaculum sp. CBA1158 TaxID=2904243 RepID=UPI001F34DB0A|nr:hypothetical protein [Halobaculum sp. CBA1158]UIO98995.1 hypothetical protein Hbl1158_10660 [Halobaculum sp. CBA1158]
MITNREISSHRLLDEALEEVVESASENGLPADDIATALRERADEVESTVDAARGDIGDGDATQR